MKITNLSAEPEGVLRSWLPPALCADHVVFLPDACPGKSPLPTGTAVLTRQEDWRQFAVSDCGCGMRLLKSTLTLSDLTGQLWDEIAGAIRRNRGGLGDLGGGNHFIDALLPYDEEQLFLLIHTGSRAESGTVDGLVDCPGAFDREFRRVIAWAEANRAAVQETVESLVGPTQLILDLPHNTFEPTTDGTVIRKGAVRLGPGEFAIIPSHMSGDASLVKATSLIEEVLSSMSHGTGRTMSRSDAKVAARSFDFAGLRERLVLPSFVQDSSLTTEVPMAYRDLDDCLALVPAYIEEVKRFAVCAYAGHR
ncbi:MAG: hypothetical protein HN742_02905 [Lentisphaerae bacterium]|jgi:RNA-splicing ligase RtcB|nr:hypothetical protein [Lentisphaerota bacterium]MBT4821160.1 hypothetical protein [Lentisphaerota bacterium]MBT5608656.1 hypothetical protein [Lentisphaerota bacterium]MBT7056585.1 hypothetical protein [Lentisphaerota bacterium]MBT7840789.1 hypothetical protein [Lentisphaerota bacterium]